MQKVQNNVQKWKKREIYMSEKRREHYGRLENKDRKKWTARK